MTRARLDANPNVPTSARASEVSVTSANAPTPTVSERLRADAVATAAVDAQATPAGIAAREIMTRAGLQRAASGQTTVQDTASIGRSAEVAGLNAREQIYGSSSTQLRPAMAPTVELTANRRAGAVSFANNVGLATDNFLIRRMDSTGRPELYRDLNQLSPDQLLAAFLKINITDPNDNPATQNKLYEISTEMRQLAIVEAKKKIENAREQQKEAEAYAQQAQYVSQIVQVVSIAMAVFTLGTSLAAAAAVQTTAATTAATVANTTLASVQTTLQGQIAVLQQNLAQATTEAAKQAIQAQITALQSQLAAVTQAIATVGPNATMGAAVQQLSATAPELASQLAQTMQSQIANSLMTQFPNITAQQANEIAAREVVTQFANTPANATVSAAMQSHLPQSTLAQAQSFIRNSLGPIDPSMRMASTAVSAGGQVVDAGAQAQLADMQLAARQTELEARRWEFVGDQAQARVEDSAQAINTMMQSRNQVIDNVMQMSQNQHVTAMRIQSAGMSR